MECVCVSEPLCTRDGARRRILTRNRTSQNKENQIANRLPKSRVVRSYSVDLRAFMENAQRFDVTLYAGIVSFSATCQDVPSNDEFCSRSTQGQRSTQGHLNVNSSSSQGQIKIISRSTQGHLKVTSRSSQGQIKVTSRSTQDHLKVNSRSPQGLRPHSLHPPPRRERFLD